MTDHKKQRIVRVGRDVVDTGTGEILSKPRTQELKNPRTQEQKEDEIIGIECPACGCQHLETYDSRPVRNGMVRRYKRCRHCGRSGIRTLEKQG